MARSRSRRKTTPVRRNARKGEDLQRLHLKVTSPRIVMHQVMRGMGKGIKCAVFMILIGLIGYGGYRGVQHLFLGNDKYRLQEIDLQSNGCLDHDHGRVVEQAEIDLGATIFAVDTAKVRERINALPEVVDCVVERRLPGTLKIRIEERVPIVWIQCETLGFAAQREGGILADANGITFPCEGVLLETARDLPVIELRTAKSEDFKHGSRTTHIDLERALHLVRLFQASDMREEWLPLRVELLTNYSMQVTCRDGVKAVFGMYGHERQLDDFISIREHALRSNRSIKRINLMPEKNIPVEFAPPKAVLVRPQPKPGPILKRN